MTYVVAWTMKPEHAKAAGEGFLNTQAAMPEGLTMLSRWHQPGSQRGWLICEGSVDALYEHLLEWGEILAFEVYPVVGDDVAGQKLAGKYG